ncbi:hypothetical protein OIV19_23490 [Brucella sp. HL-2]|nr:hypothetical protein [Brucella sp. HL-2]MCV9910505.1 hypothetical protein [Brucella sp. HL-2]
MGRFILLIPCWEGHRADLEEKRGPAKNVRCWQNASFLGLDFNAPNREDPKRQMPVDINQSPQVERMAQDQSELLKQREELLNAEDEKSSRQRQKQ